MSESSRCVILLVDDEVDIISLLPLLFEAEGFTVRVAMDGEEALRLFREHEKEIDLVITDLGLPKLGGVEMIEQVRLFNSSVKIIGASGFGGLNARDEVMSAGANAFVPKPYVASELIALAKQLLAKG